MEQMNCSHSFGPVFFSLRLLEDKLLRMQWDQRPSVFLIFQQQPDTVMVNSLRNHIEKFKVEFGFLETFLRCIYWSRSDEASDVVLQQQNLGSLVIKVEGIVKKSEKNLRYAYKKQYHSKRSVSKLITLISKLLEKTELLKPDIRETCHYLSSSSFQSRSPMLDCYWWKAFARSVADNLQFLGDKADFVGPLREQIKAFIERFTLLELFFSEVAIRDAAYEPDPEIEGPLTCVGYMVIRAAHLSCLFWASDQLNQNLSEVIYVLVSDLQHRVEPNTPEFIEMYLQILRYNRIRLLFISFIHAKVVLFVDYLIGKMNGAALQEELTSLIEYFLQVPANNSEYFLYFMKDMKAVAMEAHSLGYSLRIGCGTHLMHFTLLTKVWLMKAEHFLRLYFIHSVKNEIHAHALRRVLEFMRTLVTDQPAEGRENGDWILRHLEVVATEVESLNHSFHAKAITEEIARDVSLKLIIKIMLFRARSCLMVLMSKNAMLPVKDRMETLQKGLTFFTGLVTNPQKEHTKNEKQILKYIEAVAAEIISFYHLLHAAEITEDVINKVNLLLSPLSEKIKVVKSELKMINLQAPRINFPITNGSGFIDFFLRNLKELLDYKADLFEPVKFETEALTKDIEVFRSFFVYILERSVEHLEFKYLGTIVVALVYKAEYVIDSIVVRNDIEWHHLSWLLHVLEEIGLIKEKIITLYHKTSDVKVQSVAQTARPMISQASTPIIHEVLVGHNDREEMIVDQLTRGSLQRDIVSIVGMPGIGKTTLAMKVYNNPTVMYHFHIRAWCCVTQVYCKRKILLDILRDITRLTDDIFDMTDEDLEFKLYQSLKRKRYLIIMDDMWNCRAWDDLQSSLPKDGNGSRILITSRLQDEVLKVKPNCNAQPLRLFSDDESWILLQKKLFHGESCPQELFEVGKQIAKSCKGLPLAVVAIAGLLESIENEHDRWNQIVDSLSSRVVDDPQTRCKDILELSYNDLPNCLRACFLYFGAFVQDKDIPARKLIRLWIAEGFVLRTEQKGLEDLAEEFLMNLIGRSLVIVTKRGSNGEVKACRVHDILLDLCRSKAKEENFLHQITRFSEPFASFDDLDDAVDFDCYSASSSIIYEEYHLCFHLRRRHFVMSMPSGPRTRSLLFYASSDRYSRHRYDISFISKNFPLLRVLDLECINMGNSFPDGVEFMVQLRYLAVSGDINSVPSSIAKLWNLETFLVKGLQGQVLLPNAIWSMVKLRHLHVSPHAILSLHDDEINNSPQLDNLVSISNLSFPKGEDPGKILRKLPNLRKLVCMFSDTWSYHGNCTLDFLMQLESLKIFYYGRAHACSDFSFPVNVRRLTLSNFRLPWNCISAIGRLPNLEALKLLSRAFEGQTWEMMEGEFLKLKYLKLDTLNLVEWQACYDHLPNLQRLVLQSCKQLAEIPIEFGGINTLQIIELQGCGHSAEESVRRIKEEGTEGLKVIINHEDLDFVSPS